MLFSSLTFLFAFLPLVLLLYYLTPKSFRNYTLLVLSLFFYAWGEVSYALILIVSIIVNFFIVRRLEPQDDKRKLWLAMGLVFNIGVIVVFKYLDFIIENINALTSVFGSTHSALPLAEIALPLGISFFTFQQMSMLWDVYRNPTPERAEFANVALYISLFPQLIAGPIVRYNDIVNQIRNRVTTIDLFRSGVQRFIIGLFKKIVIANSCGEMADSIIDASIDTISAPIAWLGIAAYAFQIFFDFSGYSDMAIGLGRMFGFRILENFDFPYISRSIREFWRRWHISLSTWFRDYVYIPLGGSRAGESRTYFNLGVVFLLTGIWHGATWSFVVWGIFHGIFMIVERLGFDKILKRIPSVFSWAYTMGVVLVAWVMFRIEEFTDALNYIGRMFGFGSHKEVNLLAHLDGERFFILTLAVLFSVPLLGGWNSPVKHRIERLSAPGKIVIDVVLIAMLLASVMYVNSGSYNPFIYFRF